MQEESEVIRKRGIQDSSRKDRKREKREMASEKSPSKREGDADLRVDSENGGVGEQANAAARTQTCRGERGVCANQRVLGCACARAGELSASVV